jgi:hypothetical protein
VYQAFAGLLTMSETDAERVLQVLIHDVRTPIGVAQGYIRLIQDGRLTSPEDQSRALAKTMDALGRIAHLCEEAGAFFDVDGSGPGSAVMATAFAHRVTASAGRAGFEVRAGDLPAQKIASGGNADRLADAIVTVLATAGRPAEDAPAPLVVTVDSDELCFLAASQGAPSADGPQAAFDPWRGRGLSVPLACRVIARAQGRVRRAGSTIIVGLPFVQAAS